MGSKEGRLWTYAAWPAVILNLGAVLLFGAYYGLRAASAPFVASVTDAQIQFLAYVLVFVVEGAFALLLIRQWATVGLSLRRALSPDGRLGSFRRGPALALFVGFQAALLAYVQLASRLYGGWPSLHSLFLWQRAFVLLAVPLQAAFCEELIWRGYLIGCLEARGRSSTAAVVLSAVSFALIHGVFLVDKLLLTFALGLLTGFYFVRERRVLPLMVAHLVADLWSFGLSVL